jgi:hypothetical protein
LDKFITVIVAATQRRGPIQEQESEAIVKVLWAVVYSLKDLVGDIRQFRLDSFDRLNHIEFLLSRAQEEKASIPRAIPVPAPAPASAIPKIPTVPKISAAF